jgi:ankyrin repeat protein
LNAGAESDVDATNADGNTPLMQVVKRVSPYGIDFRMKLLIEGFGAYIHIHNKDGKSALDLAGSIEAREYLESLQ